MKCDWLMPFLVICVTITFIMVIYRVITAGLGTISPTGDMLIGALVAKFGDIIGYYFGSSTDKEIKA